MRKLLAIILALVGAYFGYDLTLDQNSDSSSGQPSPGIAAGDTRSTDDELARAFAEQRQSYQVHGSGTVSRVLADDNDGSRHQRFILRLASGQSLMVAHNIDVAPRIANLRQGDTVAFYGEYEWNEQGGVIHWTHRAERGNHVDGWLEHHGQRYQ